jgi:nicotinamidase-related amidase
MGGKPRPSRDSEDEWREPLLVVDVQKGFLNPNTEHIPERIERLIDEGDYSPILFTLFENPEGSPYHRFLDWHECQGAPETDLAPRLAAFARAERVFTKPGYAGLPDELAAYLRHNEVERLTIVGIDTDMCVLKVALDVFDLGIEPIVLVDCCASTAGMQAHLAGLAVLSRNIGPEQLRDAGLGDGRLAAPGPTRRAKRRASRDA